MTSGDLDLPICVACGMQYAGARDACPICDDDRQFVPPEGQRWTTLAALRTGHHNVFRDEEPGLVSILTEPEVAIGQRAFLVATPEGNVLWDCVSLVDEATVAEVRRRGGLAAIAVSHPHFYASMIAWSDAFGGVPIHVHADDEPWLQRRSENVRLWRGDPLRLPGSLELVHLGGHFDGFQALLWPAGAEGRGVLLSADEPYVVRDRQWVSFMHSFPNLIPLAAADVQSVAARLAPHAFDRLYGAFPGQVVARDAAAIVQRSAERYLRAM